MRIYIMQNMKVTWTPRCLPMRGRAIGISDGCLFLLLSAGRDNSAVKKCLIIPSAFRALRNRHPHRYFGKHTRVFIRSRLTPAFIAL